MQKKYIFMLLILISFCPISVLAEPTCTYKDKAELNETAGKIKSNIDIKTEKRDIEVQNPDADPGVMMTITKEDITFTMKLYNITSDIYLKLSNTASNEVKDIYYSDTQDGIYSFTSNNSEDIIKYNIEVYGNISNCQSERLKTIYLTKPKTNIYYYYSICQGMEEKVSYCKQFVAEEIKAGEDQLIEAIANYRTDEAEEENIGNKFLEFIKENYIYIIIGVGIIVGTTVTFVIIRKKRDL